MITIAKNEVPFQILSSCFTIGPSETGYELQVGADSRNFSTLFSVGANTPRMVTNVANGSYFRLKNNVGDVKVNWERSCSEGGGGGDLSDYYTKDETDAEISQAVSGLATEEYVQEALSGVTVDLSAYWTSGETQEKLEDMQLPTAAAINDLKANYDTRLNQQYYKKQEILDLLKDKITAGQAEAEIADYVVPIVDAIYATIEDKELAISAALNDLNTRGAATSSQLNVVEQISASALTYLDQVKVQSETVKTIWSGTQAEYDALTNSGQTADANTEYIIK